MVEYAFPTIRTRLLYPYLQEVDLQRRRSVHPAGHGVTAGRPGSFTPRRSCEADVLIPRSARSPQTLLI